MTRTPAPADYTDLDLALREAAEQWGLAFEVPPMPLLDGDPQQLEAGAPVRMRWTSPVLVAASIVALGAVAALVISVALPTDRSARPSVSAGHSLSTEAVISSQAPAQEPAWPVPGLQTLDILDGTPPPTIRIGGFVLSLSSTDSPTYVVTDSDHPDFLSVTPQSDASLCNGNATRIFLERTSSGTIIVTEATYHSDNTEPCPAVLVLPGPKYGLTPYPIAGQKLVTAGSDVALQHVDLADFRAPRYLPGGYDLGSSFGLASARGSGRPPGSQVRRVLSAHQQPATKDITLTWQDPAVDSTAAPRPSMKSR